MSDSVQILLRSAVESDAEFSYRVIEASMRDYAIATWGEWNEIGARKATAEAARSGASQIVEWEGLAVGLVQVVRHLDCLQLEQLFILRSHQRLGIGKLVMEGILKQSRELALPIRLRVLAVNPAKGFYERFGFRVAEANPERVFLQWSP